MTRWPLNIPLVVMIVCAWTTSPTALSAEEPMQVDLVHDLNWQGHYFAMTNWFYKCHFDDPELQIRTFCLLRKDRPPRPIESAR